MVQSSLVGHWPLHEWGGRANDLSGNDNHGTVNGATQGVAGKSGLTAYSFDGTDDNVNVGRISSIEGKEELSVAMWVKPESLGSTNDGYFASVTDGDTKIEMREGASGDSILFNVETNGNNSEATIPYTEFNVGEWTHITGTFKGEDVTSIYLNGELYDSSASVESLSPTLTSDYYIGLNPSSTEYADASISDVRAYNRALSPQEVQHLYEKGSVDVATPPAEEDSAAVARYAFDDRSDPTTALDTFGANNGVISGAVYSSDTPRNDGLSMNFDGSNDYISLPIQGDFGTGAFTVSAWYNTDVSTATKDIVSNFDGSNGFILQQYNANEPVRFFVSGNPDLRGGTVKSGSWYHIVGVAGTSEARLYQNGAVVDSASRTGDVSSADNVDIGRRPDNTKLVDGQVDDVRIYDRALSDYEVQQLYLWGTRGTDRRYELIRK